MNNYSAAQKKRRFREFILKQHILGRCITCGKEWTKWNRTEWPYDRDEWLMNREVSKCRIETEKQDKR